MSFKETWNKIVGIEDIGNNNISNAEIEKEINTIKETEAKKPVQFIPQPTAQLPKENRVSINGTNAFKLVVIEPKSFDECPKLVDSLKGRRPVIINLEKVETEVAKKIFDFLSGATYALDGNVQKVANNIFIFAPASVDISNNQDERGFSFESKSGSSPWR